MSDTPIDRLFDSVDWTPIEAEYPADPNIDHLPYATHEGVMKFAGFTFRVYQLSDGKRIIDAEDFERFMTEPTSLTMDAMQDILSLNDPPTPREGSPP